MRRPRLGHGPELFRGSVAVGGPGVEREPERIADGRDPDQVGQVLEPLPGQPLGENRNEPGDGGVCGDDPPRGTMTRGRCLVETPGTPRPDACCSGDRE
jgi:hypothetical protein